jgi:ABC-type dipeptide/oligopeptide/nickel transport system ATPase component
MVPDLLHLPRGCYFNPRCPDVMPACHDSHPALLRPALTTPSSGRRRVSCFKYAPEPEPPPPLEGRGWDPAVGR